MLLWVVWEKMTKAKYVQSFKANGCSIFQITILEYLKMDMKTQI
jgi:hypothetical protein